MNVVARAVKRQVVVVVVVAVVGLLDGGIVEVQVAQASVGSLATG